MQDFANLLLPAFVYNLSTAQLIKASSTSERRVIGVVRFFFFFSPQIPQRRRTQRSCGFVPGPPPSDARRFRLLKGGSVTRRRRPTIPPKITCEPEQNFGRRRSPDDGLPPPRAQLPSGREKKSESQRTVANVSRSFPRSSASASELKCKGTHGSGWFSRDNGFGNGRDEVVLFSREYF